MDTTNAAAATNTAKLFNIACRYPIVVVSCPIESAPKLPTASKAITETRNAVMSFLFMLRKPTTSPKINKMNKVVVTLIAVMKAAKTAIAIPTRNAHFPIISGFILYLFLIINQERKLFK